MSQPIAVNLRDMIALIRAEKLQEEIFALHAPELLINWSALPKDRMKRANALAESLDDFTKCSEHKAKGFSLIRQLNTIAIINADPSNAARIAEQVNREVYLKNRLNDSEWLAIPAAGTAILATFIHILAFREIKPSGDSMKDAHNQQAKNKAYEVWRDLVATSVGQLKDIKRTPKLNITDPTITEEDREAGFDAFCTAYRKAVKESFNQDRFYVAITPLPSQNVTRYLIKTSPMPSEVLMVNREHTDEELEDNRLMKAFDIIHDEVHGTISISKNTDLPPNAVLKMFMELVLGSDIATKPKLSYLSSLQPFRSRGAGAAITIPDENKRLGDKVWISSISLCLNDKLLPTTYRGDEQTDVYDQMSQQIDSARFPENGRQIADMTIKLRLHATREGVNEEIPTGEEKTFTIRIADRSFRVIGKEKCFNTKHLALIEKLRHDWGFDGLPIKEEKLSVDTTDADLFGGMV